MCVCNVIRDLMPLYADSAISADSRKAIRAHLHNCPDCRTYFMEMKQVRRHASPPPPQVPQRDYAALAKRMRASRSRAILIGGGILAASLIGNALSAVLLVRSHQHGAEALSKEERS